MKIPPYWVKHTEGGVWVYGWSFESMEAARRDAAERAARVAERLASKAEPGRYDYLDRPMREEILGRIQHDGAEVAILTRNRYGAVVLNSASVCFVDIDFEKPKAPGLMDRLALVFSKARRIELAEQAQAMEQDTLKRIKSWARINPARSFRLYRTAAGYRVMLTDRLYDPVSPEVSQLFQELSSDPFYRRLTEKQACFRARLTPKPWRCGCPLPPNRYPWENPRDETRYREWERTYEQKGAAFSTCRLVEVFGDAPANGQITQIQQLHDKQSCQAELTLA